MSKRKKGLFEPTPEEEKQGETSWSKFKRTIVGKQVASSYDTMDSD
jgi:hypothetical protein